MGKEQFKEVSAEKQAGLHREFLLNMAKDRRKITKVASFRSPSVSAKR